MSKKVLSFIILCFVLAVGFLQSPLLVSAQMVDECDDPTDPLGLGCVADTGLSARDPRILTAKIINASLGLLGIIATVLIIYAGFLWMTAGGNEEKAGEARKIIFAAVIGIVIILMAFAISNFVLENLMDATELQSGWSS
ncbi:MAG: pilin [Candidatus Magasanikbacteria bacterium]